MSCEYCRGEKLLYSYEGVDRRDGNEHEFYFNTKIAHGKFLGTALSYDFGAIGGASCEIEYCPKCGERLQEEAPA